MAVGAAKEPRFPVSGTRDRGMCPGIGTHGARCATSRAALGRGGSHARSNPGRVGLLDHPRSFNGPWMPLQKTKKAATPHHDGDRAGTRPVTPHHDGDRAGTRPATLPTACEMDPLDEVDFQTRGTRGSDEQEAAEGRNGRARRRDGQASRRVTYWQPYSSHPPARGAPPAGLARGALSPDKS